MRARRLTDGEWTAPRRRGWLLQCCACGLAHRVDFRLVKLGRGQEIQLRVRRLRHRSTLCRVARG